MDKDKKIEELRAIIDLLKESNDLKDKILENNDKTIAKQQQMLETQAHKLKNTIIENNQLETYRKIVLHEEYQVDSNEILRRVD